MPRKSGMAPIHILVSEDQREEIAQFADEQGFKVVADYIRGLIEQDMRAHGRKVDLKVDRGGNRKPDAG